MKKAHIIIMSFVIAMLMGCGQDYKAKGVVEKFLDNNLANKDYSIGYVSKLDSTSYINDSTINNMRANASESNVLNPVKYRTGKIGNEKLFFMRVKYQQGNETISQTFYLNKELTEVIAFKND